MNKFRGAPDCARQDAYRELFRSALDGAAISDIRQTLEHNTPLGHIKFVATINRKAGRRQATTASAEG